MVGRRDVDRQMRSETPAQQESAPTLAPDELKNVVCKVCAGTFDLSATGVFPEHFFNFRVLRKPCKASGKRFAHVNAPRGKEAPKTVEQQAQPPEDAPTPNLPRLPLTPNGKAECPACYRLLTPHLSNNTLPAHKHDGKRCRMSNRAFEFVARKGKRSANVQHYTEKYKMRSAEELRKEKKKTQDATRNRRREQEREQRRQQRHSDRYALDCYDSWGQDDHSVERGESVRTYRGGLPGQGKRR